MDPFEESGLRFTPPCAECFRFEDCAAYQRLKGQQVCEMDVGYWDGERQVLVLLELKDYSLREPARELVPKLVAKGRDCLVMLHAVWRGQELSDVAQDLGRELPEPCRAPQQKLTLIFVLKVGPDGLSREALIPMKDKLANEIKAYAELLGFRPLVLLLDHEGAIRRGLPLTLALGNGPPT